MADYNTGDINPSNPNYVMGSSGQWVLASTLGEGGLNEGEATTPTTSTPTTTTSDYSGGSIVDYLNSVGQDSSYSERAQLAFNQGIQNYQGTAAQNTQLLGLLRGITTSGSGLNNATEGSPDLINPDLGTDFQLGSDGGDKWDYVNQEFGPFMTPAEQTLLRWQQEMFQVKEDERLKEESEAENARLGLEGAYDTPSGLELYKQFEEQAGLKAKEEALRDIMSQVSEVRNSAQAQIDINASNPYSTQFIMGRNRKISEKANADMAVLISAGEIVQDNINTAQKRIENYYSIAEQDRQNEIDRRKMLYELEANDVIKLDEKERAGNEAMISFLESLNERQRAEKDAVTSLMLQNPQAWAQAAGKIDLTGSYDEIAQQLVPYINQVSAAKGGTSGLYKTSAARRDALIGAGFNTNDIANFDAKINSGMTIDDIIAEENYFSSPDNRTVQGITPAQEKILRQQFTGEPEISADEWWGKYQGGAYTEVVTEDRLDEDGNTLKNNAGNPLTVNNTYLDYTQIPSHIYDEIVARLNAENQIAPLEEQEPDTRTYLEKYFGVTDIFKK